MRQYLGFFGWLLALNIALLPAAFAQDAYKAFLEAIKENRGREVSTWLLRGVNPNAEDPKFGPALVAAAAQKSFEALAALLNSPEADVNALNARGESALMFASLHGDVKSVELLIKRGALVNKTDWTPLHYAAAGGHSQVAKLLLENHAFIDASSPNETTPIMMAARGRHMTVMRMLLDEGADPTPRNQAGLTVADYLDRVGEPEMAKTLRKQVEAFNKRYREPAPSQDATVVPTTLGPAAPAPAPEAPVPSKVSSPPGARTVENPLSAGEGSTGGTTSGPVRLPGAR